MPRIIIFFVTFLLTCACKSEEIADSVLVEKSKLTLTLLKNRKSFATYHFFFGGNPIGHKEQEGNQKTPEGIYTLDGKNSNSSFYNAIHLSYPNAQDLAKAKSKGVSASCAVMIHS